MGVKVTQQEWDALEEDINKLHIGTRVVWHAKRSLRLPAEDNYDLKRCMFLKDNNICQVYDKRPEECRRFPIWVIEGAKAITFIVSRICPRVEPLVEHLKRDLPNWARELINNRHYRVVPI